MLKLAPTPTGPTWLDVLPGVRLRLKPPSIAMILTARSAAGDTYRADQEKDEAEREANIGVYATIAMVETYARLRIEGWEGVGGDDGEEAPATPETVKQAMSLPVFYEAFDRLVFAPAMAG